VQRSLSTIFALGILAAIFMAVMSGFYLRQLPTQADLDAVKPVIRRQHGIYLAARAVIEIGLIPPEREGEGVGVRISCILRPDIRRHPGSVDLHLQRIAQTVLDSPELKGRIHFVRSEHSAKPVRSKTVTTEPDEKPAQQAQSSR